MGKIVFDDGDDLVHYTVDGIEINLGPIGKGYAIDIAVETLKMYGVERAVLHGGQSTIYALGSPPPGDKTAEDEHEHEHEHEHDLSFHDSRITHHESGWELTIKDPR